MTIKYMEKVNEKKKRMKGIYKKAGYAKMILYN